MKIETVLLGDKEYYVTEKINLNQSEYYILVSTSDNTDICVRKKVVETNEEYLVGLLDEKEFNLVMMEYRKKI